MDCISQEESFRICAEALSSKCNNWNTNLVTVLPVNTSPRSDISVQTILAYNTFGEGYEFAGLDFPPSRIYFDFAVVLFKLVERLLAEGQLKTHPTIIEKGGLAAIPDG